MSVTSKGLGSLPGPEQANAAKNPMTDTIKKWWVTAVPVVWGALYFLLPSMQQFVAAHPTSVFITGLVTVIVAHQARAPKDHEPIQVAKDAGIIPK